MAAPAPDRDVRAHVIDLLRGGNAHADFASAFDDVPEDQRGARPPGAPYSAWQLLEHLRIAQLDILQFSRDARHKSPKWPDAYWPETEAPPNEAAWDVSIRHFEKDEAEFIALIGDTEKNLLEPLPNAPDGQTLLREALLLADHNSYHIGQVVLLRKILKDWE